MSIENLAIFLLLNIIGFVIGFLVVRCILNGLKS